MKKTKKGFTLVELLVVIAILAILATVSVVGYNAFIERAYVSNDENTAAQFNQYLVALKADSSSEFYGKDIDETNVKEATEKILGEASIESLVPQSLEYGYHFYFDLVEQEYVVIGDNDNRINSQSMFGILFMDAASTSTSVCPERFITKDSRYILIETETPLGILVAEFRNITTAEELQTYYQKVSNYTTDNNQKLIGLISLVEETVFVTNNGHLVVDGNKDHKFLFVQNELIINNANNYEKISASGNVPITAEKPLVTLQSEHVIEFSIKEGVTLATYSWWFANPELATIRIKGVANATELATKVDIDFTNARFILDDGKTYVFENGAIKEDVEGGSSVVVESKNKVKDFTVTCGSVEAGVVAFGKSDTNSYSLYIHYNKAGSINLGATGFKGTISDNNISGTENLKFEKVSGSSKLEVSNDGKVTVTGFPGANECSATIKVTCGDTATPKTVEVTIVRITNATIPFNGSSLIMNNATDTIEISYTGTKEFTFGTASFADNSSGTGINILDTDKAVTITACAGDLFSISGNKLTLNKFEGTQDFTVSVGGMNKTYKVTVVDNSSHPFDIKWDTEDDAGIKFTTSGEGENVVKIPAFLYRVGNDNPITLGYLFNTVKEFSGNATLTIYDATQKEGDSYKEINASNPNLEASYDNAKSLSYADWSNKTIKFEGEGVAIIEISYNNKTLRLAVEVVDGKNVFSYSELQSGNNVLWDDIEMDKGGVFSIPENKYFYGNGFTFDITKGRNTEKGDGDLQNGIIYVNSGSVLDNTKVLGAKFNTAAISSSRKDYTAAICLQDGGTVSNSHILNCNAPVRAYGGRIINTTLEGGAYANLIIVDGDIVVENLTTINYPKVQGDTCGLGIVFRGDALSATLTIAGTFTQYNWISKTGDSASFTAENVSTVHTEVFKSSYEDIFIFSNSDGANFTADGSDKWVNTGIVALNGSAKVFGLPNTYLGNNQTGFGYAVSLFGNPGQVWTYDDDKYVFSGRTGSLVTESEQGNHYPEFVWSDNEAKTGKIEMTYESGSSITFNPNWLTATKYGFELSIQVFVDGVDYTDKEITLDSTQSKVYTITYIISDTLHYDSCGNAVTRTEPIEKTVLIDVTVTDATIKAPDFSFGSNYEYGATFQPIDELNCFVMPDGTGSDIKVFNHATHTRGEDIKYIVVDGYTDSSTSDGEARVYAVLANLQIINYTSNNNTTGIKINSSTVTSKTGATIDNLLASVTDGGTLKWHRNVGSASWDSSHGATEQINYDTKKGGLNIWGVVNAQTDKAQEVIIKYTYLAGNGITYTYFIGYDMPDVKPWTCVTGDTFITLADGTQKRVDELTFDDKILAWDFFAGTYVESEISLLVNHGACDNDVIYTKYSDGSLLKLIGEHGVFDYDLNQFVYITAQNVGEYVGHRFVKQNLAGDYDIVTMTEGYVVKEYVESWSITSAGTSNAFASGLLTVAPPEDFYNWIEMDGKLHYDAEQFEKDVGTYGLYTYEDFKDYVTYEQFIDWNGAYLKIPVEKGYFTFEYILELIEYTQGWMPQN